ncbi:hypothetical protein F5884DRAFT_440910 [Xylogone sp. PMI_703]|nr:hypothetical protein F5884DRAFT_440910 [Xylogone sp. PMI_703]
MFYTFNSKISTNRSQLKQACDYCRLHRVRCDNKTPCSQCIAHDTECLFSQGRRKRGDRLGLHSLAHREESAQQQSHTIHYSRENSRFRGTSSELVRMRVNDVQLVEPRISNDVDSMPEFISRMNSFFSVVLSRVSPEVGKPLNEMSPYQHLPIETTIPEAFNLSRAKSGHIVKMYWIKYHYLAPVICKEFFELYCESLWPGNAEQSQYQPLIDGLIALSIRYLLNTGMNDRILCLQNRGSSERESLYMLEQYYFKRCSQAMSYGTLIAPNTATIQTYIIITLYLLAGGQVESAYNMIGIAVRAAYALNFHQEPEELSPNLSSLRKRIWWSIVHLDFNCSKKTGKPTGVHLEDSTCALPIPDAESSNDSDTERHDYHAQSVHLTCAALNTADVLSKSTYLAQDRPIDQIEAKAQALSNELHRIRVWEDEIRKHPVFGDLLLDTDTILALNLNGNSRHHLPPSQIIQMTLLELQYHDIMIGLYRPFIQFPVKFFQAQRSPQADTYATEAMKHAMAEIHLTYSQMRTDDTLYGISEIYQWLWDAVLTLGGFMLAHPLCYLHSDARKYVNFALEIFESAQDRSHVATRAATLTRQLCSRVDGLLTLLNARNRDSFLHTRPSSENGATQSDANPIIDDLAHDADHESHDDGGIGNRSLTSPDLTSNPLWSWIDEDHIDPCPSHRAEADEVFSSFYDYIFPEQIL